MKKKILCGALAALMLLSSAACTNNDGETPADTTEAPATTEAPVIELPTDTTVEETTEEVTDPEIETEPPIEITAPAYEDIGLIGKLTGEDSRVKQAYDFGEYTYGALRGDNNLVFTSNLDYTSGKDGLSITEAGWNSVGFALSPTEAYTTKATFTNRSAVSNVRSVLYGVRVTRADHLYIDSGLWFTFSGSSVFAHVKGGFTALVGDGYAFNAAEGIDVTITDDGAEILCYVGETLVAKAVVAESSLAVFDPNGKEVGRTADLAKVAHGDTLGFVRIMSHFADSTTRSMSLETGEVKAYAPADMTLEIRDGYDYLINSKTQILTRYPITLKEGVMLTDAKAVATLLGFDYAETDTAATLTRDDITLTFTADAAEVSFNGTAYPFPTVVKRNGVYLIAADYVARWLGYTVKPEGSSLFITDTESKLTQEAKTAMNDYYNLYRDVIYNYDDVEIEKTGVGEYETTPYEDRLVGIAYSTWLCSKIITWGKSSWDTPLYGNYYSDDREMIAKHAELLRDAGVDFIFIDWTNNTNYDPVTQREHLSDFRMIEEATELVFEIWSQIEGAPKICIFAGPGHAGQENVKNGNHQKKVDQIYSSFVEKYPDMYFHYEGKPLLMCYGATPNYYGTRPTWRDERFTIRWVTGYVSQQSDLYNNRTMATRNNWWSWEERGLQTFSVLDKRVECVTCTAASRSQGSEGDSNYIPAYGRDNGMTLKKQFQRANDLGAGMVILVSWNEWTKGEQPSPEVSKDLEPSVIHGTFYYDLLREQIRKFKGQIPLEDTAE